MAICANMKGMKIKPGSLGKAVPPYDVQVRGSCGQKSKAGLSAALLCPALGCSRCSSELMTALLLPLSFLQIVDDHGAVVPAGEEGTIAVRVQPARPFCLFSEYLVSPAGCACVC